MGSVTHSCYFFTTGGLTYQFLLTFQNLISYKGLSILEYPMFHILHYLEGFQNILETRQCKPINLFYFFKRSRQRFFFHAAGVSARRRSLFCFRTVHQCSLWRHKLSSLLEANCTEKNHKWNIRETISRRDFPCASLCVGTLHLLRTVPILSSMSCRQNFVYRTDVFTDMYINL